MLMNNDIHNHRKELIAKDLGQIDALGVREADVEAMQSRLDWLQNDCDTKTEPGADSRLLEGCSKEKRAAPKFRAGKLTGAEYRGGSDQPQVYLRRKSIVGMTSG